MAFFRRTRGRRHDTRKRPRNSEATRTHDHGMQSPESGEEKPRGDYTVPRLPHEHDERTSGEVSDTPDPKLVQAQRDVESGIVDTDRRSAYGLSDGPPSASHNAGRSGPATPLVRYVKKKIPFESR